MRPEQHSATLLILRSQALFAATGVLVKLLSEEISPLVISAWLMILGVFIALFNSVIRRELAFIPRVNVPASMIRAALVVGNVFTSFYGYSHLPLAEAFVLSFLTPLFLTVLSKFFLKEQVGWHRGFATLVGFIGVLVMLLPDLQAETKPDADRLLAQGAMILCALFNAINLAVLRHRLKFEVPSANILLTSLWAAILALAFCAVPLATTPLDTHMMSGLLLLAATTSMAVISNGEAYHRAEASYLAPFGYIQLFWATAAAWLIWGEFPGLYAWAGAALIIASGLYTVQRERYWERRRATTAAL